MHGTHIRWRPRRRRLLMFTPSKIDEDEMIRYASFSEVLCSWLLSRKASSADKKKLKPQVLKCGATSSQNAMSPP